jgi:hypothetical protein
VAARTGNENGILDSAHLQATELLTELAAGKGMAYNADSGDWCVRSAPATDLLVGLTLPQEPYRDPSEQRVDGFYQQLDHKNDPPFRFDWRARPYTGLSCMKHPYGNPLLQFPRQEFIGGRSDFKISTVAKLATENP